MEHEPEKSSTGSTSCLSAGHRHSEREGPLTVGIWCPVPLVITRNLTTAYALDVPCSGLCGLLLYCVFRRSRHKLLREESILAIATLRDYDGTFRLPCIRMAARYVYAQLSCLDRFMLHRWLCRARGAGSTLDPSSDRYRLGPAGHRSDSRSMAMIPAVEAGLPCSDVTYGKDRAIWRDRRTTTCGRWCTPSAPRWPKISQASARSSGGMTLCAGNGMSSRSSPTSPLRRASTSGGGCAVCSPHVSALTCTTSGGWPSTAAAPPLRRLTGSAPSSPAVPHPHGTPRPTSARSSCMPKTSASRWGLCRRRASTR